MKCLCTLFVAMLWAAQSGVAHGETERDACRRLAPKYHAQAEVRLDDGTRVDLLTAAEAIEVEWSRHFWEAPAQSLHYAAKTGKRPAVILLTTGAAAEPGWISRCREVCKQVGAKLYLEPAAPNVRPRLKRSEVLYYVRAARSTDGGDPKLAGGPSRMDGLRQALRDRRGGGGI